MKIKEQPDMSKALKDSLRRHDSIANELRFMAEYLTNNPGSCLQDDYTHRMRKLKAESHSLMKTIPKLYTDYVYYTFVKQMTIAALLFSSFCGLFVLFGPVKNALTAFMLSLMTLVSLVVGVIGANKIKKYKK